MSVTPRSFLSCLASVTRRPPKRSGRSSMDAPWSGAWRRSTPRRAGSGRLAAAEQAAEGGDELLGALLAQLLGLGAEDAVARVAVEEAEGDLLERALDRADLRDDVDAVAVVLDHA